MAGLTTLQNLFIDELRDVYHAEKQLLKALPRLARAATSPELRAALQSHLCETEGQVDRLEQIFEFLDEPAKTRRCAGMMGIVEEGSDLIKEEDRGAALDAGIIAGAQRAEHYEMAAYGTLAAWATALGHDEVAALLHATLEEEEAADAKLSELAEAGINAAAAGADEGGEVDDSEPAEDEDEGEDEDEDDDEFEDDDEDSDEESDTSDSTADDESTASGASGAGASRTRTGQHH